MLLPRVFNENEYNKVFSLIKIVSTILAKNKIEHMLIDGSLLGSLRFWNHIPWDDDCDILIDKFYLKKTRKILTEQKEFTDFGVSFNYNGLNSYKAFFNDTNSPYAGKYPWRSPFIDILFYEYNKTHLWEENNRKYTTQLKNIFPLVLRPYGPFWLPSPRDPLGYFESVGTKDLKNMCIRSSWNHKKEKTQEIIEVKCKLLVLDYAFVNQTVVNKTHIIEDVVSLNTNKRIIYKL